MPAPPCPERRNVRVGVARPAGSSTADRADRADRTDPARARTETDAESKAEAESVEPRARRSVRSSESRTRPSPCFADAGRENARPKPGPFILFLFSPPRGDVGSEAARRARRRVAASASIAASSLRNAANASAPGSRVADPGRRAAPREVERDRSSSPLVESPSRSLSVAFVLDTDTDETAAESESSSEYPELSPALRVAKTAALTNGLRARAFPFFDDLNSRVSPERSVSTSASSAEDPSACTSRAARAAATRAASRAALFARRTSPCVRSDSLAIFAAACSAAARVGSSQCRATPGSPYTDPTVRSTTASVSSCLAQARAVAARERTRSSGRLEVYRRGGRNVVVARAVNGRRVFRTSSLVSRSFSRRALAASPCVVQCCPNATKSLSSDD
jgi:hypothetical protein